MESVFCQWIFGWLILWYLDFKLPHGCCWARRAICVPPFWWFRHWIDVRRIRRKRYMDILGATCYSFGKRWKSENLNIPTSSGRTHVRPGWKADNHSFTLHRAVLGQTHCIDNVLNGPHNCYAMHVGQNMTLTWSVKTTTENEYCDVRFKSLGHNSMLGKYTLMTIRNASTKQYRKRRHNKSIFSTRDVPV